MFEQHEVNHKSGLKATFVLNQVISNIALKMGMISQMAQR